VVQKHVEGLGQVLLLVSAKQEEHDKQEMGQEKGNGDGNVEQDNMV
jgi:hypothetical protein